AIGMLYGTYVPASATVVRIGRQRAAAVFAERLANRAYTPAEAVEAHRCSPRTDLATRTAVERIGAQVRARVRAGRAGGVAGRATSILADLPSATPAATAAAVELVALRVDAPVPARNAAEWAESAPATQATSEK